jgi:hypothetical protein
VGEGISTKLKIIFFHGYRYNFTPTLDVVKISEPYHILVTRYRENNLNKEFIEIFQTNKNQFWLLLMGFSYLSQNSSYKSKNLVLYLKSFALQNGNVFVQI